MGRTIRDSITLQSPAWGAHGEAQSSPQSLGNRVEKLWGGKGQLEQENMLGEDVGKASGGTLPRKARSVVTQATTSTGLTCLFLSLLRPRGHQGYNHHSHQCRVKGSQDPYLTVP